MEGVWVGVAVGDGVDVAVGLAVAVGDEVLVAVLVGVLVVGVARAVLAAATAVSTARSHADSCPGGQDTRMRAIGVTVLVCAGVRVDVTVGVLVTVLVCVGVRVGLGVTVAVCVAVGVLVTVAVAVGKGPQLPATAQRASPMPRTITPTVGAAMKMANTTSKAAMVQPMTRIASLLSPLVAETKMEQRPRAKEAAKSLLKLSEDKPEQFLHHSLLWANLRSSKPRVSWWRRDCA